MRKQRRRSVTAKLISAFVFTTWIIQFLFYLNPKFQASSHLLWLYSPVCVGPGRKPRRPVFSQRGSFVSVCYNLDTVNQLFCDYIYFRVFVFIYIFVAFYIHGLQYCTICQSDVQYDSLWTFSRRLIFAGCSTRIYGRKISLANI